MKPMGRFANLSSNAYRDPKQIKHVARGHKVPPALVAAVGHRWGKFWERMGRAPDTNDTRTILHTVEWDGGTCTWCVRTKDQGHSSTCAFKAWKDQLTYPRSILYLPPAVPKASRVRGRSV